MSGWKTTDTWFRDFMAKASPEKQEEMRKCLRDPNFFVVGSIDELKAAIKQIEGNKKKN